MGGHSQVVSATGAVLAEAGGDERRSGGDGGRAVECVLSVDVDLAVITEYREAFPVLGDRRL